MLVVRADDPARGLDDLRGRRVAFNALDSQSGHNALRTMLAPLAHAGRFFGGRVVTGSHGASADTVAAGDADLCAIDCVTWALLARHEPERVAGLRVLGRSAAAPGLPLITGRMVPLAAVRAAVLTVLADPALAAVARGAAAGRGGGADRARLCADPGDGAARAGRGLRVAGLTFASELELGPDREAGDVVAGDVGGAQASPAERRSRVSANSSPPRSLWRTSART